MVKINGIDQNAENMTLMEYLSQTNYNTARIAVEKNGEIVPKSQYSSTLLEEGDSIEIVSFVGGG